MREYCESPCLALARPMSIPPCRRTLSLPFLAPRPTTRPSGTGLVYADQARRLCELSVEPTSPSKWGLEMENIQTLDEM